MTKLSPRGLVLTALAALALVAGVTACSTGTLGVTNFDGLTLSENLKVGNGTPSVTLDGEDAYVEGTFEVDGAARFDGAVALNGATTLGGAIDLNGADLIVDADADTILDETADDNIRMTSGAATGLWNILTGNLKVGNGTPGNTLDGEDLYVEGGVEADGGFVGAANVQNLFVPTYATASFTYTSAAGGTVDLFTIPAGQIWMVADLRVRITEDFAATGDDSILLIGDDANDDGYCENVAAYDATYQIDSGWPLGWVCEGGQKGSYINPQNIGGSFPAEGPTDITVTIDETSGESITSGAATVYLLYTRIQ